MKRLCALLLLAAIIFGLGGCGSPFEMEYYSEQDYEPASETVEADDAVGSISSYAALRRAISRLVAEHTDSAELTFQNYDGSISQDISTACWEVKSSTGLGAFAVDYISYDLSRIVSYYQAEIFITYKRSAYQVEALEQVDNLSALASRLETAIRNGETYLVLGITAASVTTDAVTDAVETAYYADPLACPVLPGVEAALFPETGVEHVIEVTLDYGLDSEGLLTRRAELAAAMEDILTETADVLAESCVLPETTDAAEADESGEADEADEPDESDETGEADETTEAGVTAPSGEPFDEAAAAVAAAAEAARVLRNGVASRCVRDETAGPTAWDALVGGAAASEGIALAYEACCRAMDIPCMTVFGRLDGETYVWNIVTLGDEAYHVDVSAGDKAFLKGDEALWGVYWWDTSEYPVCPHGFGDEPADAADAESAEPAEAADSGEAGE